MSRASSPQIEKDEIDNDANAMYRKVAQGDESLRCELAAAGPLVAGNLGSGTEGGTHAAGAEERTRCAVVFAEIEVDLAT